jgi:hypothetical protein
MKRPELWGPLAARFQDDGPRKMLALDGGGIRGVLTLAILKSIEETVGKPLYQYFDYVAGTSTGAIIAAGIACGMSVDDLIKFYRDVGPEMFQRSRLLDLIDSLYRNGPLQKKLKEVYGEMTDLGPANLKTLLLVVTRNVTTDSPWPLSSNPEARYNGDRSDCNLRIPVWQLVRASTAAPIYFPPEIIQLDAKDSKKTFVFVDGGVTPYNNPAFLLYRFATEPAYRLNWKKGERQLLLVSVGTGAAPSLGAGPSNPDRNIGSTLLSVPGTLMYGVAVDQDINCRAVGRCTYGDVIDRELLDMIPREGSDEGSLQDRLSKPKIPLSQDCGRAFLYARYNADLSLEGLNALGIPDADPDAVSKMDNATPDNIEMLLRIGRAAGKQMDRAHFGPFV